MRPELPRSLSIEEHTEHYRPDWRDLGPKLRVYLDGVYQEHLLAFDCDGGWVKRYVTNHDGYIILDDPPDRAKTEVVHGEVTVSWREGAHA